MKEKFTVIGGDERSIYLAYSLLEDGHDVKLFGFDTIEDELDIKNQKHLKDAIRSSDVIVGPLPFSRDGETINALFSSKLIKIEDLFKEIRPHQTLIVGKVGNSILSQAKEGNIHIEDYFLREEMQVLNAIPTAEGAIATAMRETKTTIHGSKLLVLGFGRIGKVLSKMLQGIGGDVSVVARKHSDIAWINTLGYIPVLFKDLGEEIGKMDIVFNTIPSLILDKAHLERIKKDSLVIDLASKPGGVNFKAAKELGVIVKWELGVPGKVAPMTAAEVVKETVYNIIDELGE